MDMFIWIAFLIGAPALLYWMGKSNRQRRAHWREWCRARDWRIEIDNEGASGAEHAPGLPVFPLDQSHRRRQSVDMVGRGAYHDAEAATWEWNTAWRNMPAKGRGATISNKLHAVGLRLASPAPTSLGLLPPQMALLSMSGMLSLPHVDDGIAGGFGQWTLHARDSTHAREWLRSHGVERAMSAPGAPPDLALLQVEGDWMVAWHLGEMRLDRIDSTLAWLSGFGQGR